MTGTIAFALRTSDADWIARNSGTTGEAGRVFVQVPAGEVEMTTLGGKPMLRRVFADCPRDMPNATIVCPAAWVPGSAEALTRAGAVPVNDRARAREMALRFLMSVGR